MRVLVTGAGGFLGRHVMAELERKGHEAIAANHRHDLRKAAACTQVFNESTPNAVIHCAARCGGIGRNQREPATLASDTLLMGLHVLEQAAARGIRTVMVGSVCAYPEHTPVPFREDDLWAGYPEPTNAAYGVAKRTLVAMAEAYRVQHGLDVTTALLANLYGPHDNINPKHSHVVPAIIRRMLEAEASGAPSITLWGSGHPTRDLLYVTDAAEALVRLLSVCGARTVNVGTGYGYSIREVAVRCQAAVGWRGPVIWDRSRPDGQLHRYLDVSLMRMLGWSAQTSLEQGLAATVAWMRQEMAGGMELK